MLTGQEEVFHHRHILDQSEVLVHHAEAQGVGLARILDFNLLRAHDDPARVGAVGAHDALDQRALAGPILTQKGVERAGRQSQRNIGQGLQSAEALGDVERLHHRGRLEFRRHAVNDGR